jgi:hypothetical protein
MPAATIGRDVATGQHDIARVRSPRRLSNRSGETLPALRVITVSVSTCRQLITGKEQACGGIRVVLALLWREFGQPALQAASCDTRRKAVGEFDVSTDILFPCSRSWIMIIHSGNLSTIKWIYVRFNVCILRRAVSSACSRNDAPLGRATTSITRAGVNLQRPSPCWSMPCATAPRARVRATDSSGAEKCAWAP